MLEDALPLDPKPARTIANTSKSMFGKSKPLFGRSNAYVYYNNPHSTENVFSEKQSETLLELRKEIEETVPKETHNGDMKEAARNITEIQKA